MSKRVLVLGGNGFLGRRTVEALRAVGAEVEVGSRRSGLDLRDPLSFAGLEGYPLVVNCTNTVAAPPDAAALHVVAGGGLFVETTAEIGTHERLLALDPPGAGALILGAGLFPGVSNLLAASAAQGVEGCDQLELGLRFSPLSGAGPGTVDMMVALLDRPLSAGPALPFASGSRVVLQAAFCEPPLLARSLGVEALVGLDPVPALLRPLAFLAARLPLFLISNPLTRLANRLGLRVLRSLLLRWRASPVELVAVARGQGQECIRRAHVLDGFAATAVAIAALCERLLEETRPLSGVLTIDQAITLEDLARRMNERGSSLKLT